MRKDTLSDTPEISRRAFLEGVFMSVAALGSLGGLIGAGLWANEKSNPSIDGTSQDKTKTHKKWTAVGLIVGILGTTVAKYFSPTSSEHETK